MNGSGGGKRSLSWLARFTFALTGVLMPGACIGFSLSGARPSINSPWQTNEVWVYASLLLSWPAISTLLPLILFSMISLTLLVICPSLRRFTILRFGIYAGPPLAAVYLGLFLASAGTIGLVAAVVVGLSLTFVLFSVSFVARNWRRFSIKHLMLLTALIAFAASVGYYMEWTHSPRDVIGSVWILTLAAAPALNLLAYGAAAIWLFREETDRRISNTSWVLGTIGLTVAWAYSWKAAVEIMLDAYGRLPAANPNCYISAAAANGHASFVGSRMICGGQCRCVNTQMQRLKFFELTAAAAMPRFHARLRICYDRWGPGLAGVCQSSVWFADIAYVTLKPIEWLAELIRWTSGIPRSKIERLYR